MCKAFCYQPRRCRYGSKSGRACCRHAVQQSTDIACHCQRSPRQQTRRTLRTDGRTDGRTADSCIDYAPHTARAVPINAIFTKFVDTSRHEVARGHCDRRPRHCCMSHSDDLPSANALSALQHHLSGTLSLSPFRTVTRLHYLNVDLKHICSPPFMLLNCPVRQRL